MDADFLDVVVENRFEPRNPLRITDCGDSPPFGYDLPVLNYQ